MHLVSVSSLALVATSFLLSTSFMVMQVSAIAKNDAYVGSDTTATGSGDKAGYTTGGDKGTTGTESTTSTTTTATAATTGTTTTTTNSDADPQFHGHTKGCGGGGYTHQANGVLLGDTPCNRFKAVCDRLNTQKDTGEGQGGKGTADALSYLCGNDYQCVCGDPSKTRGLEKSCGGGGFTHQANNIFLGDSPCNRIKATCQRLKDLNDIGSAFDGKATRDGLAYLCGNDLTCMCGNGYPNMNTDPSTPVPQLPQGGGNTGNNGGTQGGGAGGGIVITVGGNTGNTGGTQGGNTNGATGGTFNPGGNTGGDTGGTQGSNTGGNTGSSDIHTFDKNCGGGGFTHQANNVFLGGSPCERFMAMCNRLKTQNDMGPPKQGLATRDAASYICENDLQCICQTPTTTRGADKACGGGGFTHQANNVFLGDSPCNRVQATCKWLKEKNDAPTKRDGTATRDGLSYICGNDLSCMCGANYPNMSTD